MKFYESKLDDALPLSNSKYNQVFSDFLESGFECAEIDPSEYSNFKSGVYGLYATLMSASKRYPALKNRVRVVRRGETIYLVKV